MRATIDLPNDVYEAVRAVAEANGVSLGDALTELARQGLADARATSAETPFPTFAVPVDAEPITLEQTFRAEDGI